MGDIDEGVLQGSVPAAQFADFPFSFHGQSVEFFPDVDVSVGFDFQPGPLLPGFHVDRGFHAGHFFDLPEGEFDFFATEDGMPSNIRFYTEDLMFEADFSNQEISEPEPDTFWQIPAAPEKTDRVALSHLARFAEVALSNLN